MLVEIIIALGLILIVTVSFTHGILASNRMAAANRVLTAARSICQRNIDDALSLRFDSTTVPEMLGYTSTTGSIYDDDGGADNVVNILTVKNGTADLVLLQGTLRRVVSAIANPAGADIRKVTFRVTYTFQGRDLTTEMSTIRATDD